MQHIHMNYHWQRVVDDLIRLLEKREEEVGDLLDRGNIPGIQDRINKIRKKFTERAGLDFDKNPLNPKLLEIIPMEGYCIEKIVIEALPGYYVPINVYVPGDKSGKYPAVLVPMGHYIEGKQLAENQIMCGNFARNGFIAATYDPICQGERDIFPDRTDEWYKKDIWVVEQHMRVGHQSYMLGESSARYFIWDGIRVIDYLCTREDVDHARIGCTGQSGGGTATYYITALDNRIKALVPIHCLTKYEVSLRKYGIGDPEQTIFGMWDEGAMDMADFLWLAFPRPVLINAGIRDYFEISGVEEIYTEIKKLYRHFNIEDRVSITRIETDHYISRETREACYNWFKRWLNGRSPDIEETKVNILSPERLYCLSEEQKLRTALHLNKERFEKLHEKITSSSVQEDDSASNGIAARLKRYLNIYKDCYNFNILCSQDEFIEFSIVTNNNYDCWCKLYKGEKNKQLVVIIDYYQLINVDELRQSLNGHGFLIINPFAAYTTGSKNRFEYNEESAIAYGRFILGRNMIECRLNQILCCLDYVRNLLEYNSKAIVIGTGQGGILSILAAAHEKNIIGIAAIEMISNYGSIFMGKDYFINETDIIPGMIAELDIEHLIAALCPRHVLLANLKGINQDVLQCNEIEKNIIMAVETFKVFKADERLLIINEDRYGYSELIRSWIKNITAKEV